MRWRGLCGEAGRWLFHFLKLKTKENATQSLAFIGICIITLGLTFMNVMGALAGSSGGNIGQIIIRIALGIIISGAELLAAVTLVRVMLAPNRLRKAIGILLFMGLAWACIQNGKKAVHLIYPEFSESASTLYAKADLADRAATEADNARESAKTDSGQELERVRTEIADLRAEQLLMASSSPEKIMEAQRLLIAQGKYQGRVDGLAEAKTESAMRARGEEISKELQRLKLREDGLTSGAATTLDVSGLEEGVATDPAILAIQLREKARKARAAELWVEVMLWVFEMARSFGLWALVATVTTKGHSRTEDLEAQIKIAEMENRLNAIRNGETPSETKPKSTEPPAPDPQTAGRRKGGESAALKAAAGKIDKRVPVGDERYDTMQEAAE